MNWIPLTSENQLKEIDKLSFLPEIKGILLFKHSTRCSISSMALNRLERKLTPSKILPVYLLDILSYRTISTLISSFYQIEHASPQVLIIKDGKCIYTASHSEIDAESFQPVFNS